MAPSDSTPNTRAFLAMNGAGCSHPALDTTGLVFDQGRRAWIDRNHANLTISTAASRFRKALEALERECPQQTTSQLSIRSGHSWKDVLSVAGSAVAEKKDRSIKSFFSHGVDKAGAHAASIEQVFSALKPDGEYTSIICGGFSLILRAFARLPKLRKEAIDVVASAPQLLERTERLIALDADQALQDKADALYVALLYVLEEIISWYPHIGKNLIVEIALPGLSFDKKGKIAHLNNCVAELEKQSDLCNKERLYSLAITLHSFMAQAEKNHDETAEMQRKILEGQKRLDFNQNVMMALMGSIYGGPVPHVQPLVPFERFLASTEEKYKLGQDVHINDIRKLIYDEQAVISHLASQPPPKTMYSTEIIRQLGVDAADGAADAVLELVKARRDHPSLRLISPLLSDPRFRLWLTTATSDLLFVLPEAAHPRDSDTAYITASIYRALQQMPTAITLVHFCAQQNRTKTREAVYDMMAHLVSQLLTCSWLSAFPCSASFVGQCAAGDLKALSELLEHLLGPAALPNATVYLLIDGFATVERDDEEADYGALVRLVDQLKRIVHTSSPGRSPAVKILIMEPDFRGDIIGGSNPDEILRLSPARYISRESDIDMEYAQLLPGDS